MEPSIHHNVAFFRDVRKNLPKEAVEADLWVTKKGVFVRIEGIGRVIDAFHQWFQAQVGTDVQISREKAERKLFGEGNHKELYLIVGSQAVVGSLIECATDSLRGAGIRLYEGMPLDTASTLHHSDPIFQGNEQLKAELSKTGYRVVIATKRVTLSVPFEIFPRLRDFFISTGEMRKFIRPHNLRHLVETFARSVEFMRPLPQKDVAVIPTTVVADTHAKIWMLHGLALVEKEGTLAHFFGLHGKARESLLRSELESLTQQRRVGDMHIRNEGGFLAQQTVAGIPHKVGVSAILSFTDQIFHYAEFHRGNLFGKLKHTMIAREIVRELGELLKEATPCLPDKVPASIRDATRGQAVLITRGEWYFAVDKNRMVRAVYFVHRPKRGAVPQKSLVGTRG